MSPCLLQQAGLQINYADRCKSQERSINTMLQLHFKPRREQAVLLAACTRTPQPVERPRAVPAERPQRPVGIGRVVLDALFAEDAPVAKPRPLPGRDCIEYLTAVSVAITADHERHLDTLRVINDIRAAAPDTHTLAMLLAPVADELAPYTAKAVAL